MKERQKTLNETDENNWYDLSKEDKLKQLYENLDYDKLITYFGNINSKVVFLGIAPIQRHVDSESKSAFCFDINLHQEGQSSGSILQKVFKRLDLNITDYFFDNIFKIPVEKLTEKDKKLFRDKLDIELETIKPDIIICLGNDSYNELNKSYTNVNVEIQKVFHPAAILRGLLSFEGYVEQMSEILKK